MARVLRCARTDVPGTKVLPADISTAPGGSDPGMIMIARPAAPAAAQISTGRIIVPDDVAAHDRYASVNEHEMSA
jgi:hypothetical protein